MGQDAAESASLETHSTHPHQKHGDVSHATEDDNTAFFSDIAAALADMEQILVVGSCGAKAAFVKYLTDSVPTVAQKVKAMETVDHPSDGQLLAYARQHFVAAVECSNYRAWPPEDGFLHFGRCMLGLRGSEFALGQQVLHTHSASHCWP